MRQLKELTDHIKKYKDAVIIIGPGVQPNTKLNYTKEEFSENYTRKKFRREPEKLWDFFLDKLYYSIDEEDINTYVYIKNLAKDSSIIVDQNMNSPIIDNSKIVNIHGNFATWCCPKCKITYTSNYVMPEEDKIEKKCEVCGSYIRPKGLFVGERYDQANLNKIVDKLNETHTLFLIGVDYSEETILNYISEYGNIAAFNSSEKDKEDKVIVAIQSKEEKFDPNELAFCDFLVKDNIKDALERFMKEYNK